MVLCCCAISFYTSLSLAFEMIHFFTNCTYREGLLSQILLAFSLAVFELKFSINDPMEKTCMIEDEKQ